MPTKKPSAEAIDQLYIRWLQGESLRAIASTQTPLVSHSTISGWFKEAYGEYATDPTAMSLARSILEDYPDQENILEVVRALMVEPEKVKHRSNHSLQQLSNYQCARTDTVMDYLAVSEDPLDSLIREEEGRPYEEPLGLGLTIYWLDSLVGILRNLVFFAELDRIEAEGDRPVSFEATEQSFRYLADLPPKTSEFYPRSFIDLAS